MVKTEIVERIRAALGNTENIRNISVIAHVDHGKSTLTDSLVAKAGLISQATAGEKRFMDTREDEQLRTITIKSTSVSMVFDVEPPRVRVKPVKGAWKPHKKGDNKEAEAEEAESAAATATATTTKTTTAPVQTEPFLVNLIDSPGHIDFSSEVTAALRVTDGALVVVDCIEGVRVQTETVLRQAITERVRPALFVNKLDRLFLELNKDPEEAYQMMARSIESVNVIIAQYSDEALGPVTVHPENGSVGFGSGLQGWGFTLDDFAVLYHDKFGISKRKMMKKLWGDNFYDPQAKKWRKEQPGTGKRLDRGFVQFVLRPLMHLFSVVARGSCEILEKFVEKNKLTVTAPNNQTQAEIGRAHV